MTIDDVRRITSSFPRSYEAEVRLDAVDRDELGELLEDAWRMVVPKFLGSTLRDGDARGWGRPDNS